MYHYYRPYMYYRPYGCYRPFGFFSHFLLFGVGYFIGKRCGWDHQHTYLHDAPNGSEVNHGMRGYGWYDDRYKHYWEHYRHNKQPTAPATEQGETKYVPDQ